MGKDYNSTQEPERLWLIEVNDAELLSIEEFENRAEF